MSWFDDLLNDGTADKLINLGIGAGAQYFGLNDPQVQKVGYQGEIPEYDMLRERVPGTYDPNRRPGSGGQRYFTDAKFVPRGTLPAPMSAEGLAALNASNPARRTRPVGTEQEAMLSDGEFVVPADVVSHLGNGNSDAGAKELYDMMDRIRKARTGTTKQGKEIDPAKFLPA